MNTNAVNAIPNHPAIGRLDVGVVAVSTWGYNQTNVDFYLVTERKVRNDGSSWVKLQEICSTNTDTELFMQYTAMPLRTVTGNFTPKATSPTWRKVHDGMFKEGFRPASYSWATPWNGQPVWGLICD